LNLAREGRAAVAPGQWIHSARGVFLVSRGNLDDRLKGHAHLEDRAWPVTLNAEFTISTRRRSLMSHRTCLTLLMLPCLLVLMGFVFPGRSEGDKAEKHPKEITNTLGMKLVLIPAGRFKMGSPKEEKNRYQDEEQHEVEITKPFYMGVYEVTQGQFKEVMGYNPSFFSKDGKGKEGVKYLGFSPPAGGKERVINLPSTNDLPVENVSWEEAQAFLKRLSQQAQEKNNRRKYRLPTEAEWEYACRAGASSYRVFHYGNSLSSKQANFDGNFPFGGADRGPYLKRTCKVGSYKPNAFGLYDMHGNVNEWCSDWFAKDYYKNSPQRDPTGPPSSEDAGRVIRGGHWDSQSRFCRSAQRTPSLPGAQSNDEGFRAVLVTSPR
jgi:formylglycine-generating enzyme required for sulfatase activity